jgi:hypothetical protein
MSDPSITLIRPRTVGEILDDAVRLCVADASLFLAYTLCFLAPAAIALLVLMSEPRPVNVWLRLVLPTVTGVAFALTGLASAMCQDLCLRRSQGEAVTMWTSLRSLVGGGLGHACLRILLIIPCGIVAAIVVSFARLASGAGASAWPVVTGALAVAIIRLLLGPPLFSVHPAWTSSPRSMIAAVGAAFRDSLRQPSKATILVLVQILMFFMAVVNIHLLLQFGLSVASVTGVDTAVLRYVLSPANSIYILALMLLVWMASAPLSEAIQFLFYVDSRARHEGLDLWFRVERSFPSTGRTATRVGAALVGLLLFIQPAVAAQASADSVKKVRAEVQRLRDADPYPSGRNVETRLQTLARELDPEGSSASGEFRWFYRAVDSFHDLSEAEGRATLKQIDQNLALVERNLGRREENAPRLSREQLKSLVPPADDADVEPRPDAKASDDKSRVKKDDEVEAPERARGGRGPSVIGIHGWGGFNVVGWALLGGLLLLVMIGAGALLWHYRRPRSKRIARADSPTIRLNRPDRMAELLQQDPQTLWREADRLARQGEHLEALRCLYAALLGLLHRAGLIKLESARTNGEYVRQLQGSCHAQPVLADSFTRLTTRFEHQWYGEKSCQPQEYADCRERAEAIRQQAG